MPKIEFILSNEKINPNLVNTQGEVFGDDCPPKPAKNFISQEYKNLQKDEEFVKHIVDAIPFYGTRINNDIRNPTVKKCVPFLDAMTSGYIIPFYQDYIITINLEKMEIEVNTKLHQVDFHDHTQLPENYQEIKKPMGKFTNKWIVRTPPGYSCLFVHPMNQTKTDFEIISGVVDTDSYEPAVFFPFYWRKTSKDYSSENLQVHIKKGDPMVQVIPFKRESWKSWTGEKKSYKKSQKMLGVMMDIYKKYYWKKKKYE